MTVESLAKILYPPSHFSIASDKQSLKSPQKCAIGRRTASLHDGSETELERVLSRGRVSAGADETAGSGAVGDAIPQLRGFQDLLAAPQLAVSEGSASRSCKRQG